MQASLIFAWCQSAITPLKYSCSLILVAQWTLTSVSVKSYSRPPTQNSNTWKLFTSITVFMNLIGRAIFAALISAQKPGKYYENMGKSEERRVGKECRSRWWPNEEKR